MTGHTVRKTVTEYEDAMNRLHETADGQREQLDGLDAAMADLHDSIGNMHEAVGEYEAARAELTDAVEMLQRTVTSDDVRPMHTDADRPSTAAD